MKFKILILSMILLPLVYFSIKRFNRENKTRVIKDYYSLSEGQKTSTEKFYLSWFTSNGSITNSQVYVDEKTILKFDQTLPEKAIVTVFLRDGRGGVAFNYVVLE